MFLPSFSNQVPPRMSVSITSFLGKVEGVTKAGGEAYPTIEKLLTRESFEVATSTQVWTYIILKLPICEHKR